jgi:hypothetical protein
LGRRSVTSFTKYDPFVSFLGAPLQELRSNDFVYKQFRPTLLAPQTPSSIYRTTLSPNRLIGGTKCPQRFTSCVATDQPDEGNNMGVADTTP